MFETICKHHCKAPIKFCSSLSTHWRYNNWSQEDDGDMNDDDDHDGDIKNTDILTQLATKDLASWHHALPVHQQKHAMALPRPECMIMPVHQQKHWQWFQNMSGALYVLQNWQS
jgi:hypothetical protein